MRIKNRREKLYKEIQFELDRKHPDIDFIMGYIDDYEQNNLETIDKLKKEKTITTKKINGALRQTINAHGPITKMLIGSACKRIYGALLDNTPKKKESLIKRVLKWITK